MSVTPSIFKAYDVRGIYPDEFDESVAELVGQAFVTYLNAKRLAMRSAGSPCPTTPRTCAAPPDAAGAGPLSDRRHLPADRRLRRANPLSRRRTSPAARSSKWRTRTQPMAGSTARS